MGLGEVNELISMLFKAFSSLRLSLQPQNSAAGAPDLSLVSY